MAESDLSPYYRIIRKPLISEKSTILRDRFNHYSFRVAPDANKVRIREAVERIFNVQVLSIRTMVRKGKMKRVAGRIGRGGDWKRAIVTLAEGNRIEIV